LPYFQSGLDQIGNPSMPQESGDTDHRRPGMPLEQTLEQDDIIARCVALLDEDEIEACERDAAEIAGFLLNEPRAADDLTRTLVWIILQNAEKRGRR
jgi:hypothetical protein